MISASWNELMFQCVSDGVFTKNVRQIVLEKYMSNSRKELYLNFEALFYLV